MAGGALSVPHAEEVLPVANHLAQDREKYSLIVATQDWHPVNHISFAINHPGKKVGDIVINHDQEQMLWPVHCVQGTWVAALSDALDQSGVNVVIQKGTNADVDSYSGFFDNDHVTKTKLENLLRKEKITDVDVMGLATDYCVKATAIDAARLGFKTRLLKNGSRGVDLMVGDVERALAEAVRAGIKIMK